MRSLLGRYGFAAALVFLYLYSFPYFARIHSANELPRIYLVQSMVDEGRFAIDSGVRRWGATADVSPWRGHQYSNKAPGSSFAAVPAYLALRGVSALGGGGPPSLAAMTWTFRFATGVLPTLLFLLLLWRFLARFAPAPSARRLALTGYALGSMAMTYSVLFISHQLSAVCIGTAYILCVWVVEDGRDERWLLAAGLAAGAAPLCDYQAAFAGVPVAAYLVWHLLRRPPRRGRAVAFAVAGAIPPIALLLFYHWRAFGSPLRTGYAASKTFAVYHQVGLLGLDQFRWEAFVGSTVRPDNGLFFLSPMWLLMLPGFWLLARRRSYWALAVSASVVFIYLLFVSSLSFWRGGWQMGPRYITAMLPFALVPVACAVAAAERRWWTWAGAVGLVAVSVAVYAVSCAEYPHFPEKFANPLREVTLRLLADGHAPWNLGWLLGLRGLPSLIPYLAVLAAVILHAAAPTRAHRRGAALGLLAAALILCAYAAAPGGGAVADRAYHDWVAGSMPPH